MSLFDKYKVYKLTNTSESKLLLWSGFSEPEEPDGGGSWVKVSPGDPYTGLVGPDDVEQANAFPYYLWRIYLEGQVFDAAEELGQSGNHGLTWEDKSGQQYGGENPDSVDFEWLAQNYATTIGANDKAEEASENTTNFFGTYISNQEWSSSILDQITPSLLSALKNYRSYHLSSDGSYYGKCTDEQLEWIEKNIINQEGYSGLNSLLSQNFFKKNNFERYVSIYGRYILDADNAPDDRKYGFIYDKNDRTIGEVTQIEGETVVPTDQPNLAIDDTLLYDSSFGLGLINNFLPEQDQDKFHIFDVKYTNTDAGFTIDPSLTQQEKEDIILFLPHGDLVKAEAMSYSLSTMWIDKEYQTWDGQSIPIEWKGDKPFEEGSKIYDIVGILTNSQVLISGKSTEGKTERLQDLISWEDVDDIFPNNSLESVKKQDIRYDHGQPDFSTSARASGIWDIENFILEMYMSLINDLNAISPNDTDADFTFGQPFRTAAYFTAEIIIRAIANERANIFKAELYEIVYKWAQEEGFDVNNAYNQALGDLKNNEIEETEEDPLTEEELELRQQSLGQCALLANMLELSERAMLMRETDKQSNANSVHKFSWWKDRLYSVSSDEPSTTFTRMQSLLSDDVTHFLYSTPAVQAALVPKIDIQQIYISKNDEIVTVDVPFNTYTTEPNSRRTNIITSQDDGNIIDKFQQGGVIFRGGACGIKSVSFNMDGETPATAEKYIKVELKMFFQDFHTFIEDRTAAITIDPPPEEPISVTQFKYMDLLVNPMDKKEVGVPNSDNMEFFDPSFYRIKLNVGWNISDGGAINDVIANSDLSLNSIKSSLSKVNKSFLLCAIDHSINITNEGAVEVTINYQGYGDTLLRSHRFNALIPWDKQKEISLLHDKYQTQINNGECTSEQIAEFNASMAAIRLAVARKAHTNIISELNRNNMIRIAKIDTSIPAGTQAVKDFQEYGQFRHVPPLLSDHEEGTGTLLLNNAGSDSITFFYLGDLLYVLLECMYVNNGSTRAVGAENIKFILTDFAYNEWLPQYNGGGVFNTTTVNMPISSIPIETGYFLNWFVKNISGLDIYNMPVMTFIMKIANDLCGCMLSEICFSQEEDKSIFFRQGNILADTSNRLQQVTQNQYAGEVTMDNLIAETVITDGDAVNSSLTDFEIVITALSGENSPFPLVLNPLARGHEIINYMVLYVDTKPKTAAGNGDEVADAERGIAHFNIGANKGILKTAQWSKTNVQYLREARTFNNQGLGDYAQLATVYTVNMKMFGNFLFTPGMMIYLNPFGIGGTKFGDPTIAGRESDSSLGAINFARLMGIGGYHQITHLRTTITPTKFETDIKARFIYSGDESGNEGNSLKRKQIHRKGTNVGTPTSDGQAECVNAINAVQNKALTEDS